MQYTNVAMAKTPEGTFSVSLINNNLVVATIVFPTEALAAEYLNFKTKGESGPDSPATKAVLKDLKAMVANDTHEQVMDKLYEQYEKGETPVAKVVESVNATEPTDTGVKADTATTKPLPVREEEPEGTVVAKIPETKNKGKNPSKVDVSAKAAKNVEIDTSAKSVEAGDINPQGQRGAVPEE
jgi:hypothetical protein